MAVCFLLELPVVAFCSTGRCQDCFEILIHIDFELSALSGLVDHLLYSWVPRLIFPFFEGVVALLFNVYSTGSLTLASSGLLVLFSRANFCLRRRWWLA